jgi:hypothetical protein
MVSFTSCGTEAERGGESGEKIQFQFSAQQRRNLLIKFPCQTQQLRAPRHPLINTASKNTRRAALARCCDSLRRGLYSTINIQIFLKADEAEWAERMEKASSQEATFYSINKCSSPHEAKSK